MASLKDLRRRIRSTRSMQQIFKAMEMVAAAKLRRAQVRAQAASPYAKKITEMLASIAGAAAEGASPPAGRNSSVCTRRIRAFTKWV